jgi:PX domain-containing protein kinase-like protein
MLGRQILEGLYFLYENNLVYGHLHSGNILFDFEQSQTVKLLDITNIIAGLSSKYRYYISNFKHIHVSKIKL